ncbi:MAG: hypothetical protein K9J84_14380 [Bacteroidia bacterium]|nr:hypothetical protein [Bacteroidia bacterium]
MEKRPKYGGRQRGTPNKITKEVKEKFEHLLNSNLDTLQIDLNQLSPRWRVHYILELGKFVIPTMKAQDIDLNLESNSEINSITVTIANNGEDTNNNI